MRNHIHSINLFCFDHTNHFSVARKISWADPHTLPWDVHVHTISDWVLLHITEKNIPLVHNRCSYLLKCLADTRAVRQAEVHIFLSWSIVDVHYLNCLDPPRRRTCIGMRKEIGYRSKEEWTPTTASPIKTGGLGSTVKVLKIFRTDSSFISKLWINAIVTCTLRGIPQI